MRRRFALGLPSAEDKTLTIEAELSLYIPRLLQFHGLSGYETETLACFIALLDEDRDGAVLDIGANVGVFSWLAAAAKSRRRVVAFEPFEALADTIEAVADNNSLAIEVQRCALSDASGKAELFISNKSDCSHSLNSKFRNSGESVSVKLDTVDAVTERLGLEPAIMKIDTETTEPAVLRGAAKTIARARPWMICEVLPGTEAALAEALAGYDYKFYRIGESTPFARSDRVSGSNVEEERNWLLAPQSPSDDFWRRFETARSAIASCHSRSQRVLVDTPAFAWNRRFKDTWRPIERDRFRASRSGDEVSLTSDLGDGERLYFFHGKAGFDDAGQAGESVAIEGGAQYELSVTVRRRGEPHPATRLWAFHYDDAKRIQSDRAFLGTESDDLVIRFDAAVAAKTLRVAFQLTGPGSLTIGPIKLEKLT